MLGGSLDRGSFAKQLKSRWHDEQQFACKHASEQKEVLTAMHLQRPFVPM